MEEEQIYTKVSVVIELEERLPATEVDVNEILLDILEETGLTAAEVTIAIETDEFGFVVSVIVYVNNPETATVIAASMETMDKGEGCQRGVLCRMKGVTVKQTGILSGVPNAHSPKMMLFALLLLTSMMAYAF